MWIESNDKHITDARYSSMLGDIDISSVSLHKFHLLTLISKFTEIDYFM